MEQSPRRSLREWLAEPVDGASLAFFRFAFGLTLFVEVCRFFAHGWIGRYYIEPTFHFHYYGFGWVHAWPSWGMYAHFTVLGVVAICAAIGLWYRASAVLLWLMFTYVFLLEEARYLNHFYAASLFALLLAIVPAATVFSIDSLRHNRANNTPIPRWALWIVRFQTGAIYFFGGVAKINPDWMRGEPMRSWLLAKADSPIISLIVRNNLELALFSYGGMLFDLCVVPALLWRRTRPFAFAAAVMFHTINSRLFSIGIFPWMMLAATTLFFEPDWPRRLAGLLARSRVAQQAGRTTGPHANKQTGKQVNSRAISTALAAFLAAYCLIQVAVPLRHFLYPGNVSWTEEGHLFSWHMKLRDKDGSARFVVTNKTTHQSQAVDPNSILQPWQTGKMATRPDMILQFAHYLAEQNGGANSVQVHVQSLVSLNDGSMRPMINPGADLAAEPRSFWPAWWITRGDDDPESVLTTRAYPQVPGNLPVRNR